MRTLLVGDITHIFLNDEKLVRDAIEPPSRQVVEAFCTLCSHRYREHAVTRGEIVTDAGIIANCRCCARTLVVPVIVRPVAYLFEGFLA